MNILSFQTLNELKITFEYLKHEESLGVLHTLVNLTTDSGVTLLHTAFVLQNLIIAKGALKNQNETRGVLVAISADRMRQLGVSTLGFNRQNFLPFIPFLISVSDCPVL
jgi:hypothetical protein